MKRGALDHLRVLIEKADFSDDRVFANTLKRALTELRMVPAELAAGMRIPKPTALRWMNAVTAPAPNFREATRKFFLKKIAERDEAASS